MGYYRWMQNIDERVMAALRTGRIQFWLPEPDTTGAALQSHIDIVLDKALECGRQRGCACFKVGITYQPAKRIDYDDYSPEDRIMYVAAVSESSDEIAQAERDAIARFRRYDRSGELVNPSAPVGCQNRAPGGEGAHHGGFSPFCLYVVCGNEFNWRPSEMPLYCREHSAATATSPSDWHSLFVERVRQASISIAERSRSPRPTYIA